MFTRIIDTLRTNSNSNNNSSSSNSRRRDIPEISVERRSSTDEDNVNNDNPTYSTTQQRVPVSGATDSALSSPTQGLSNTSSPTTPTTTGMKHGNGTNAIGIKHIDANGGSLTDTVVYPDGRRRSSLFGYSTNAADDYMQKDLLSSSWS